MELRSSDTRGGTALPKYNRDSKATAPTESDYGTSSGARNRGSRSASSSSASSGGRRTSSHKRQTTSKSLLSSCSNSEHCSKNDKPLPQHDGSTSHDSSNGQVMGYSGNSSASSVQSRQRDMLMYVLLYDFLSYHVTKAAL